MDKEQKNRILITIDVEDWFQVENLRPWFPVERWGRQTSRIEYSIMRLLGLLDASIPDVKATFFILGWIAKRFPHLVREINMHGHEIASHGYGHLLCTGLSPKELRSDLDRSKKLLEDILGSEIKGYRAPSFSVNDAVLEMVKRAGYRYDSSYNSFGQHGRYGKIETNGYGKKGIAITFEEAFSELPISNLSLLRQTLPWGGGGYFRLLPSYVFLRGVRHILKKSRAYLFYMHPWEIDDKQPRVGKGKGLSIWRHYLNLDKTYNRLSEMISCFDKCDFITCSQYLETLKAE